MQIIRLKFRQTDNYNFYVTLNCNDRPWEVEGYLSLMPTALKEALSNWQAGYRQMHKVRANLEPMRIIPKSVRVNSSCESINSVKIELNAWLNSYET